MKTSYYFPTKFNEICLIGEAPGATEEKVGLPFQGKAGKILDKALVEADIQRENCLIANTFRVRPKDNKVAEFYARNDGSLNREYGGINLANSDRFKDIVYLHNIIKLYSPKIIVALGRTATWAVAGDIWPHIKNRKDLELRGKFFFTASNFKCLSTYHPSYVRYSPDAYKKLVDDLKIAKGQT